MSDHKNEPYIENYPELHQWLDGINAVCNWQQRIGSGGTSCMVECFVAPGSRPFIVLVWANGNGWHVYTESTEVITINYLADTKRRIMFDLPE